MDSIEARLRELAKDAPNDINEVQRDEALALMERVKARVMQSSPPSLWGDIAKLTDRVVGKINEMFESSVDEQVRRILDSEPYVSERRAREADMALFKRAMLYSDSVLHDFWVVKDLKSMGVAEPNVGCRACKDDYDLYMSQICESSNLKKAKDALQEQRLLLDNAFENYKPVWAPKPPTIIIQGRRHNLIDGRIEP